jgi:hypothetical protein
MKKISILIFLVLLGFCFSAVAKKVEISDARLIAKNTWFEQVNRHNAVPFQTIAVTSEFVEKFQDKVVYYAFNVNHRGFVIIAADDVCFPVIAFSFESSYSPSEQASEFAYWMNLRKEEIAYNIENNIPAGEEGTTMWQRLNTTDPTQLLNRTYKSNPDISPLITTLWDQGFPYNELCPAHSSCANFDGHVTTGCIATAMAQIMFYWRWPNIGSGSKCDLNTNLGLLCANFDSTNYDWNGMVDQPTKENIPIATLMSHCGISVNMHYNSDGACSSGANTVSVAYALKSYFRYSPNTMYAAMNGYSTADWNALLQGDLNAGLPIQYAGADVSEGHSWVCDGFMDTIYYHMNWGWSGSDNGYYYLNNLNPSGYHFNSGEEAVVHITPDPAQYPLFCTGNSIINKDDYGTIEDGSGPVANYNNQANCSWLIAPDDSVSSITLTFEKFNTDPADILTVYDGPTTSAPVLGTFSGSTLPTQTLTSSGSQMLVTFVSNSTTTAPGFLLNYSSAIIPFCSNTTTLTDTTGTFSDYSGRFQYRNNSNCRWNIYPPNATSIAVSFSNFNTEAINDKVVVFNLGGSQAVLVGEFSGDHTSDPIPTVTVNSGKVMVMWISNKEIRGDGWNARYDVLAGIEDKNAFQDLSVFPNPTEGMLNIRFTVKDRESIKLEILSSKGENLYNQDLGYLEGTYSKQLDLSSFAKGIYILRLTGDRGITNVKIVVK